METALALVLAFLLLHTAYSSKIYVLKCRYYTTQGSSLTANGYLDPQYRADRWQQRRASLEQRHLEQRHDTIYYIGKTDNWARGWALHQRGEVLATKEATKIQLWRIYEDDKISALDPSQAEDIVFMYVVKKIGRINPRTGGLKKN